MSMMMAAKFGVVLLVALGALIGSSVATLGIDVSTLVSIDEFKCLKNQGYDFLIVRAYQSLGRPDPNAVHTLANAHEAGFINTDVYMFPCPKCGQASSQISSMVGALGNISFGQIWLDIEGSQYWLGSKTANRQFFEELLTAASGRKATGVYASESQWSEIMGLDYKGGSSHQLWYVHYDGSPSFGDFKSFGGWSRPSIKQYAGDVSACGAGIDKDYY